MCNSVRANRIAVPDTVAMASDSRNHATRKIQSWRSFAAVLIVVQSELQANVKYRKAAGTRLARDVRTDSGGPGRSLSHNAPGMESTAYSEERIVSEISR